MSSTSAVQPFTHPIHLVPMHPLDASSPTSDKDIEAADVPSRERRAWKRPTRNEVLSVVFAVTPLTLHALGLALVVAALLQDRWPSLEATQIGGTGKVQFNILNSCSVAPGTTDRVCTSRSMHVNFMPSIIRVSHAMPGMSSLRLPFRSEQTPSILLSGVMACFASFLLYLPLWSLAYFPHSTPLPAGLIKTIQFHSRKVFQAVGVLSFVGMIITFTIGLGNKLLMTAAVSDFNAWIKYATRNGALVGGATAWRATCDTAGHNLIWASTAFQILATIGIQMALHNGLDERVERPDDSKQHDDYNF